MAEKDKMDTFMDRMDAFMNDTASRLDAMEKDGKERADAACARMDAFEKKGEAEEVAADKARKDSEEKAEKEKADAEEKDRKDSEEKAEKDRKDAEEKAEKEKTDAMDTRKRIDAIEAKLPRDRTDADVTAMTDVQVKVDSVMREFGQSASRFQNGEDLVPYRRRLLRALQEHSPTWKPVDLATVSDSVLDVAEAQILNDARAAARDPRGVEDGALRMIPGRTEAGHRMNSFVGRPSAWLNRFGGQRQFVTNIDLKKGAA